MMMSAKWLVAAVAALSVSVAGSAFACGEETEKEESFTSLCGEETEGEESALCGGESEKKDEDSFTSLCGEETEGEESALCDGEHDKDGDDKDS